MSDDIYSLTGECEMLRGKLVAALAEIAHLQTHNANQERISAEYRKQWSELKPVVEALQAENNRLRSEIKESNGKLAQVRDAWMRAENDLQTSMEDAKGRYKECEKLREKRDTLTAAVNALLAAVDAFYPERDGYGDVMNAADAVREAMGGGK